MSDPPVPASNSNPAPGYCTPTNKVPIFPSDCYLARTIGNRGFLCCSWPIGLVVLIVWSRCTAFSRRWGRRWAILGVPTRDACEHGQGRCGADNCEAHGAFLTVCGPFSHTVPK